MLKTFKLILMACFIFIFFSYVICQINLNRFSLSEKLENLVEETVKAEEMQKYLNLQKFEETSNFDFVYEMFKKIERQFEEKRQMILRLSSVIQKEYNTKDENPLACCDVEGKPNQIFNATVDFEMVCIEKGCCFLPHADFQPFTKLLLNEAKSNMRIDPFIKWQYVYHYLSNTSIVYPASNFFCRNHGFAQRAWYYQESINLPKRVVILVDLSVGVGIADGNLILDIIKEAILSLFKTLTDVDKFSVILFSSDITRFKSTTITSQCYFDTLSQATSQNLDSVFQLIKDIKNKGGSNFRKPLQKAFQLLLADAETPGESLMNRGRIILLISDGNHDDPPGPIFTTVLQGQQSLNSTVAIIPFKLGNSGTGTLEKLAEMNPRNTSEKQFYQISYAKQLLDFLPKFHNYFSSLTSYQNEPLWTFPQSLYVQRGDILTVSLPIVSQKQNIVGVVALEVTTKNMFGESFYFQSNAKSYSFAIDDTGIVIFHSNYLFKENSDFVYLKITSLEREKEFISIYNSMLRGENGMKFISTKKHIQIGLNFGPTHGSILVNATYIWRKIPHTRFSICFVVSQESNYLKLVEETTVRSFLHHRIDLFPHAGMCKHFKVLSSIKESTIFLQPRCFQNPEKHFYHLYTNSDIQVLKQYFEGNGSNVFNITARTKRDVYLTYKVNDLWNTSFNENSPKYLLMRFVNTNSGVTRLFPGTSLALKYQPIFIPWFNQLIDLPKKIAVTKAFQDYKSSSLVVKIGKPLVLKHKNVIQSFGAIGFDMFYVDFLELVEKTYEQFFSSGYKFYLLDESANIIIVQSHKYSSLYHFKMSHLISFEPDLTQVLIKEGILIKFACSWLEAHVSIKKYQFSYNLETFEGQFSVNNSCYYYNVASVPNISLYIIVREFYGRICDIPFLTSPCSCNNKGKCQDEKICECPCAYSDLSYIPCINQYSWESFQKTSNSVLLLNPPICYTIQIKNYPKISDKLSELQECFLVFVTKNDPKSSLFISTIVIWSTVFFAICLVHSCRKSNLEIGKLFVSHETSNADIDVPDLSSSLTPLLPLNLPRTLKPIKFEDFEDYYEFKSIFTPSTPGTPSSTKKGIRKKHKRRHKRSRKFVQSDTAFICNKALKLVKADLSVDNLKPNFSI